MLVQFDDSRKTVIISTVLELNSMLEDFYVRHDLDCWDDFLEVFDHRAFLTKSREMVRELFLSRAIDMKDSVGNFPTIVENIAGALSSYVLKGKIKWLSILSLLSSFEVDISVNSWSKVLGIVLNHVTLIPAKQRKVLEVV